MRQRLFIFLTGLSAVLWLAGCRPAAPSTSSPASTVPDPLRIVLAPHAGNTPLDAEIRDAIAAIGAKPHDSPATHTASVVALEKLGWLFISKARVTFDPGFYKLAEQCALAIEAQEPASPDALLLRGHVLQNLHRFHDAEPIARTLVSKRGASFDFGLLGDVLMEQGNLPEAIQAYQRMADLRPDSQALARIAHVRFLKGDLEGAIEAARDATRSANPRDAESSAWMHTRLALYEFQSGHADVAQAICSSALKLQTNYPPALLLRGRIFLAGGDTGAAIEPIRIAAGLNPLPEYQWALAESVGSSRVDLQACKLEYSIVSPK